MKSKSIYTVDKHITLAMYYDNIDHGLRRSEYRRLWMSWTRIKNMRASSAFWTSNSSIMKPTMINLGDPVIIDSLCIEDHDIVGGGGTYTRAKVLHNSMLDCDFYQAQGHGRDYGIEMTRTLFWTLSKQWMLKMPKPEFVGLLQEQMEIIDSSKPHCGLIDYSFTHETYAGFTYGNIFCFSAPLHQCIQRFRWLDAWNRGKKLLRGLYWGTYLSNTMMLELGGRDTFLSRYHAHLKNISRKSASHIWEYPNGIFIRLTPNINNVEPGKRIDGVSSQNFQWLARELDQHNLLL
jgi:hypothetical protein